MSNRKILAFAFIVTILCMSLIYYMKITTEALMMDTVPSPVTNLRVQ